VRRLYGTETQGHVGGIKIATYCDFLFGESHVELVIQSKPTGGLLGGHMDDTGGSAFEAPIPFIGDSSRAFLVLYCSFVDGIDRGIQLPLLYTLKTHFHMSQLAASAAIGISLSPWLFKPFLALVTDTIPIFGYKRKPYIFGSALVNAVALSMIGYASLHGIQSFAIPLILMTLRTFGRAMIDAAAQGLLLEDCRQGTEGEETNQSRTSVLISRFQAAHRLGQFLNVCASGYLMSTSSITTVYFTMAAAHVGTMILAWASEETRVTNGSGISGEDSGVVRKFQQLKSAVTESPPFRNILEYTFLSVVVPSYEAPMAYYLLDARHFSVTSLSIINIVQTFGSVIAPVLYSEFFQRSKYSSVMFGLTIASIPASLMPLLITTGLAAKIGLNEVAWAAASAFTLTLVNDLQLLPAHVLVAQLAPRGLEGSSLSVLTVVEGSGRVVSNVVSSVLPYAVGAVAPKYTNMSVYVILCTVFNIGPVSAIEGFDEIGRPRIEEEVSVAPAITSNQQSFGTVFKELRDADIVSLISSGSDLSPMSQVSIKPQPSSETSPRN
jgi:hypothetical protein